MFAEGPPRVTPGMLHRELAPALLDLFLIVEPRVRSTPGLLPRASPGLLDELLIAGPKSNPGVL